MNRLGWNALPGYEPSASRQTSKYLAYAHDIGRGTNKNGATIIGKDAAARRYMQDLYNSRKVVVNAMREAGRHIPIRDAVEIGLTRSKWKIDIDKVDPVRAGYRDGEKSFSFEIFNNISFSVMRHALLNLPLCAPLLLRHPIPLLRLNGATTNGMFRNAHNIISNIWQSPESLDIHPEVVEDYHYDMHMWCTQTPQITGLIPIVVHIPAHAILAFVNIKSQTIEIYDASRHAIMAKVHKRIVEVIRKTTPQFATYTMSDPLRDSSPLGYMQLNPSTMCNASISFMLMVRLMNFDKPVALVAHYLDSKTAFEHFLAYVAYARDLFFMGRFEYTSKFYSRSRTKEERNVAKAWINRFEYLYFRGPPNNYLQELKSPNVNGPLPATKLTFDTYRLRAKNNPTLNEAAKLTPGDGVFGHIMQKSLK
jgi:hypothetical protein